MQTDDFALGQVELRTLTPAGPVALMCAEAVPWRCHRSLRSSLWRLMTPDDWWNNDPGPHRRAMMSAGLPIGDDQGQPCALVTLPAAAPFNLQATVRLLQRRPTNRIDHWEQGHYRRAFSTPDGLRLAVVENAGSIDAPAVRLEIHGGTVSDASERLIAATVRWMLGLDTEPAPAAWLAETEPRLAPVARAVRGFRPPCFPNLFESCARVVPFQQLSIDAGTAIVGRLVERFGPTMMVDGRGWIAFPADEVVADAPVSLLREAGLSRAKVTSLQALARLSRDGQLDVAHFRDLSTGEALARLQAMPGIGPWSAGLILLRGLRRLDVFPPGDVGAARNLTALLGLPHPLTPAEASALAARFGERQGYLYFLGLASQLLAHGVTLENG